MEMQVYRHRLLNKSYKFLNQGFAHFRTDQKIHIALELIKRDIPIQGEGFGDTYISNIVNSFNSKKELTDADKTGISERMGVLEKALGER